MPRTGSSESAERQPAMLAGMDGCRAGWIAVHAEAERKGTCAAAMAQARVSLFASIEDAAEALGRNGVRIQDGMICIASPHKYIERILIETPWEVSYSRTLLRLEGAKRSDNVLTFAGVRKRAICVPVSHVL